MKLITLLFITATCFAQTHCVVSEIMFAPLAGEPEWVEIYNPTAQPINVKNWKIRDLTATKKVVTTKDAFVAPGGYMVLAHDTILINFHFNIPSPIIALSLPSLNNDSDAVILYDADGYVVDSLIYHSTWGGSGGASIERIRASAPSASGSNWRSSVDAEKSTPGRKNSNAPRPFDAALDSVTSQLTSVNTFFITAYFRNAGEFVMDDLSLRFAVDNSADSVIDPEEIFLDTVINAVPPGALLAVSMQAPRLFGSRNILAAIAAPNDGDSTNNHGMVHVNVTHVQSVVVINEIMYAPAAPEPEWIEVQNCGVDTIDCTGWHVSTGTTSYALSAAPLLVSGDYLVIVRDSDALRGVHPQAMPHVVYAALPTLSNSGSKIILRDERNVTIDSVSYLPTWGGASGKSLERVDSSARSVDSINWRASTDNALSTCGHRNSAARRGIDAGIWTADFNEDSTAMLVEVRNFGLRNALSIAVTAKIDSLTDGTGTLSESVLSLVHGNGAVTTIPIGNLPAGDNLITVCAEVDSDEQPSNNCVQVHVHGSLPAGALTINEIMFAPHANAPEYFEVVNTGSTKVNLYNCRFSGKASLATHKADTTVFGTHPDILDPGGYAVIASDTSLLSVFPVIPENARVIFLNKSSIGLSNDSDVVVVGDASGNTLDSVLYHSSWHSPNVKSPTGIALERINPRLPSNEHTSWASSVAARGGTPGERNSIFTLVNVSTGQLVEPARATLSVAPNPFSPDGDGWEDFTSFHYAIPFQTSTYTMRIFDAVGRMRRVIVNTGRSASQGLVMWDGRDDEGLALPMGMYIAVLDAVDVFSGSTVRAKASVVVARKL